jgi:hypothetical protein
MKMRTLMRATFAIAGIVGFVLMASPNISAQKLPKSIYYQAQAMGEANQMGQNFGITLIIEEYSTPDDQKALLTAFNEKQNEGLVNALSKMKTKGRLSITGTLGYDVSYIRTFPMPDGSTKIRLVTNRPITFGEAWSSSRSMDYNLSGVELIISPDKKKNSGTLLPACQFKMDKEGQLQIELLQNAWKLVNIMKR